MTKQSESASIEEFVNPDKNYARLSHPGHVQTGQQIRNLLELATPKLQAMLLLDIWETNEPATSPTDRYGLPEKANQ